MELGALKPLITTMAMPLASLPLIGLLGTVLLKRRKPMGLILCMFAFAALWLLSCQAVVVWLAHTLLPQYAPATAQLLKTNSVQAIVVLGGGTLPQAPEYGASQPNRFTAERLRYGVWLAKQSGLPAAFTGGSGWAAGATVQATEAEIAGRIAQEDYGFTIRWLESKSRDTGENARLTAPMLKRDGIERIALVTDALHMTRAIREFESAGLLVTAAPTAYLLPNRSAVLQWLPSAETLHDATRLAHEVLGLQVARLTRQR